MYPKFTMKQAAVSGKSGKSIGARQRRIQMRRSAVHGKGVYAVLPFEAEQQVIEYTGELISWPEALRRHPHDPDQPDHTFYFHIDDKRVIDGGVGGNQSRWINHGCDPNCETEVVDGRVFVKTLRPIEPGEELFYDYRLIIDEPYTSALKKQFTCRCGAQTCRGTMLAPKRERRKATGSKKTGSKKSRND